MYLKKLPPEAHEKDIFYCRPLENVKSESESGPWYTSVPVGKHTLGSKIKLICEKAGISGHKTNHSLRATAATEMYQGEVPEKLIQERTGHRSLKALRVYERSTEQQYQAVSSLLSSSNETTFQQEVTKVKQTNIDLSCQPISGSLNFTFQNLTDRTINIMQGPPPTVDLSK